MNEPMEEPIRNRNAAPAGQYSRGLRDFEESCQGVEQSTGPCKALMESHPVEEATGWPRSGFAVRIPWVVHQTP